MFIRALVREAVLYLSYYFFKSCIMGQESAVPQFFLLNFTVVMCNAFKTAGTKSREYRLFKHHRKTQMYSFVS